MELALAMETAINRNLADLTPAPKVTVSFPRAAPAHSRTEDQHHLTITAATSRLSTVRIRDAAKNDTAAALMLGTANGGIELSRYSNFRPEPTACVYLTTIRDQVARLNAFAALRQDQLSQIILEQDPPIAVVVDADVDPTAEWSTDTFAGHSVNER